MSIFIRQEPGFYRHLRKLSLPIILQSLISFSLGLMDTFMVSQLGKAIGEGQSHAQVLHLSHALLRFTVVVGAALAATALVLVPTVFCPYLFPLFKLSGAAVEMATAFAVTAFAMIPIHAYTISAITGVLRSGGDVLWSTLLDIVPQWAIGLPLTALTALVWETGIRPIAIAMQVDCLVKVPLCMLRVRPGKWIHDVTLSKREETI